MSLRAEDLVASLRQLAAVRPVTLGDGPERGVRALLFSTGGGLDFMVLVDRAMDIGTLSFRGVPLAWQSPSGFRHTGLHDAEADGGYGFNRSLSGFLVTAGLDHIRHPKGGHPHHGRIAFTPARLLSGGEDWEAAEPLLYCEGEIVQWRYGGEALRLIRRIEAPVGGTTLRIRDRVENLGAEPSPFAILYHFNLGTPAIGPGSTVSLNGDRILKPLGVLPEAGASPARLFPCPTASTSYCTLASPHDRGALAMDLRFPGQSLPYLQLWRDLRPRRGIFSIEPCSAPAVRGPASSSQLLDARKTWSADIEIGIKGEPPFIPSVPGASKGDSDDLPEGRS